MLSVERAQGLHDRVCRGESLSSDERESLDEWYAAMDADENRLLSGSGATSEDVTALRQQLRNSLARLEAATAKTREIEQGNEELRRQNEELMKLLKEKGVLAA